MGMTPSDKAKVAIAEWQDAYRQANGKDPPKVIHKAGWITIFGKYGSHGPKRRVSDIQRMTERLRQRMAENKEANK